MRGRREREGERKRDNYIDTIKLKLFLYRLAHRLIKSIRTPPPFLE